MRKVNHSSERGQIAAFAGVVETVEWPDQVGMYNPDHSDAILSVFGAITKNRLVSDWMPSDIILAAQLARLVVQIESVEQDIAIDGMLIYGGRKGDTKIENPLCRVCSSLYLRATTLNRQLGLTGHMTDKVAVRSSAKSGKEAEKAMADINPFIKRR